MTHESQNDLAFYGCKDDSSLSEHLKCVITQGSVAVVGMLPEGYTSTLQHNWISPFEDATVGSVVPVAGDMAQAATGRTSKGRLNTLLTWEGSEPKVITIPLFFEAENNPNTEVRLPAMLLERMSSPTFSRSQAAVDSITKEMTFDKSGLANVVKYIKNTKLAGDLVPQTISIKIGKNLILRNCVIESVEKEDPMRYSVDGLPLQMSVTLVVKTRTTLDTNDILNSIG